MIEWWTSTISCYGPQTGRSVNEKEEFYELMDKSVTSEKVLVGGNFNGHDGSVWVVLETFIRVWVRKIDNSGMRLLDWAVCKGLGFMNSCFQKKKSRLITFRLSETETMIKYIIVNSKYRRSVKDVKVIPAEEIVNQHYLLLMDIVLKKKVRGK